MDIQRLINSISENECIKLYTREISTPAMVDGEDKVEEIDGVKCVIIRHTTGTTPVPEKAFYKAVVMDKLECMLEKMLYPVEIVE